MVEVADNHGKGCVDKACGKIRKVVEVNNVSLTAAFQANPSSTKISQKPRAFNMHGHALLPTLSLI